jgi:tetratricopeptide (TPR) repeat protein
MKMELSTYLRIMAVAMISIGLLAGVSFAGDCKKAMQLSKQASRVADNNTYKAKRLLREAVTMCPDSASLRYNLAMINYSTGNPTKARADLEAAVEMRPGFAAAHNALAVITLKAGESELALQYANRAAELAPWDRHVKDTLAMVNAAVTGVATKIEAPDDIDTPVKTKIKNPNAIAVVIGNQKYTDNDIPSVDFATNDANTVKNYLIDTLGYQDGNIIYMENATKANFEATFGIRGNYNGKLYSYLKPGKSDIFVFYSGHGAPDVKSKQGYFVPSDASSQSIALTGYSLELLYDNLASIASEMRSPRLVIVVDACFSGGSEAGLLMKNVSPMTIEVAQPFLVANNAVVLSSSSGAEVSSWYPEKKHSMFTYFFLKAIQDKAVEGGKVTANDLFTSLSDEAEGLPYYARRKYQRVQTPQIMGNNKLTIMEGGK